MEAEAEAQGAQMPAEIPDLPESLWTFYVIQAISSLARLGLMMKFMVDYSDGSQRSPSESGPGYAIF